jgi:hypothetical protein
MKTSELITVASCTELYIKYRDNWSRRGLHEYAKSIYSENGEDGIVEQIFQEIGGGRGGYFVEFGAWDGQHLSNTKNLSANFHWTGLLLDGKFDNPEINLHQHYLTAENIVKLFTRYQVPYTFDLLSIDIDGNDIYLLKKILTTYRPRVIVCETNQLISPTMPYAITYDPSIYFDVNSRYFGASVAAFDDLTKKYSYVMIGQHDQNAFFITVEEATKLSSIIDSVGSVESLYKPRIPRWYLDSNGKEIELTKAVVEDLACKGSYPLDLHPIIEKSMKNFDVDGEFVLFSEK